MFTLDISLSGFLLIGAAEVAKTTLEHVRVLTTHDPLTARQNVLQAPMSVS